MFHYELAGFFEHTTPTIYACALRTGLENFCAHVQNIFAYKIGTLATVKMDPDLKYAPFETQSRTRTFS